MRTVLLQGTKLLRERYEILRPLGAGGMGAAYLVQDTRLLRTCVVKEVLSHDTLSRVQFEREAQILASLSHPHLPVVYDYFIDGDSPYILLEYIAGQTLDRLKDDLLAPFQIVDVLKWGRDLLDALHYLHEHEPRVIHRDIKPHNVCISPQGEAMLLDFGIARHLDRSHTSTAAQAVTLGYAPVEQYPENQLNNMPSVKRYVAALHAAHIRTGPYSDIYGLGATLYFALTLLTPTDACMRVLGEEIPPIPEINPDVPTFLVEAVTRALAIDPRERFQTAAEMLNSLQPQSLVIEPAVPQVAAPEPLPTSDVEIQEQKLIYIQAGSFLMGSNDLELKDNCRPQHKAELNAYCIGQHPVTNTDYQLFINANPDIPVPFSPLRFAHQYNWDERTKTFPRGLDDHPVVLVTRAHALAYTRWLSRISGHRCRLPTEAEWERAAGWDADAGRMRLYPWGDTFDPERCNVDDHGALRLESTPVGAYSPLGDSPFGLQDMAGNVWEWTGSKYKPYPGRLAEGGEISENQWPYIAIRGSAFDETPITARCAWRDGVKPTREMANIGFRVACDAA